MTPSQTVELRTRIAMESGLQTPERQRTPDLRTWTQNSRPRIPPESGHQTGKPPDSRSPDLEFRWTSAFQRNTTGIPADSGWNPAQTWNSGPIFTREARHLSQQPLVLRDEGYLIIPRISLSQPTPWAHRL